MTRRFHASNEARTISTFSCDIARAVSPRLRSRRERLTPGPGGAVRAQSVRVSTIRHKGRSNGERRGQELRFSDRDSAVRGQGPGGDRRYRGAYGREGDVRARVEMVE